MHLFTAYSIIHLSISSHPNWKYLIVIKRITRVFEYTYLKHHYLLMDTFLHVSFFFSQKLSNLLNLEWVVRVLFLKKKKSEDNLHQKLDHAQRLKWWGDDRAGIVSRILSINEADTLQSHNDLLTKCHCPRTSLHPQHPSQTLSSGHRNTTNHPSIAIDMCIMHGYSIAECWNYVFSLLSEKKNPESHWAESNKGWVKDAPAALVQGSKEKSKIQGRRSKGGRCEDETHCKHIIAEKEKNNFT